MTNDQAIKVIECLGWGYPDSEIKEAVRMAAEALEYRTPKKISIDSCYNSDTIEYSCPRCNHMILEFWEDLRILPEDMPPFCSNCGQAIDWSEVEE